MRLLLLNYEYPPIGGGGGNATAALINEYKNIPDLRIDIVTSAMGSEFQEEQISERIVLYRLPVGKTDIHYWRYSEIIKSISETWKFCRKIQKKYDLCHVFFGIPGGINGYFLKIPYILSLRGSDVPGFNPRFARHYPVLKPVCRRVWKKAKRVVANSMGLRQLALQTAPNQKIDVIPNGINTEQFTPRDKIYDRSPSLQLLTVSRLIERKEITTLLEAVAILKDMDILLDIIGEGNLSDILKDISNDLRINKKVKFHGYVPHDSLPIFTGKQMYLSFLHLGRDVEYSSRSNSLRASVIVTNTGGTLELCKDNGIIVPKKDPKALANAIGKMRSNSIRRIEMSKKSREIAEEFSWKESARKYYWIYQEVMHGK